MFKLSQRSLENLSSCEESLIILAKRALELSPYDFGITCGIRTIEEQKNLVESGASQTMKSRHLPNANGKAEALDFAVYVGGKLVWDRKYYRKVIQAFFTAAIELGIQIEAGGLWENFVDGPHIQLKVKS
jgi:peptidoglycan L-alanyl-D-glutamate endopeptidase CwlK